ncbi:MAG: acetylornithine deacetylase [Neisseria sp.]|uniref:acetylornithine deacetylase n=1 Tax=Uruburuella suis TaxID=252130 RepID=UPI001B783F2E|nr:acetylornithine deacetylase [Neisseria sp.]MBP8876195.1 acetylornithine deacetylase [Neisseria sp.]
MNTINRLSRLIAFDTTSRHSNLALIHDCADYLESLGLKPWLSHNADQSKANLFATIAAADGNTEGGLILSGHTDVVPTDGQAWQSDPYRADIREGRLYGRGSADMKGFIAAVLAAAPAMVQAGLKRPLHIALSYDEEIGCLGAPVMIAELQKRGLTPEHCIVGEPTSMRMVVAHKGIHTFRCAVHGKAAHSSLTPQGVNAIEYAAKLIVFINELAGRLKARHDTDPDYDVPFSTLSVNTIAGGIAGNIVPQLCEFEFDYRNLPHMSPADITAPIEAHIREVLQPQMQAVEAACRIDMRHGENVPAMPEAEAALLHDLITQLVQDSSRLKVAYATEGGQFQQAGIATVICGPGNIEQAHKADEFVELSQLARCDAFLHKLIAAQSV